MNDSTPAVAATGSATEGSTLPRAAWRERSWPVILCGIMLILVVGRLMELFSVLKPFRLGMISLALALVAALVSRRLHWGTVAMAHGTLIFEIFMLLGLLFSPFSVWPGGALQSWWNAFSINAVLFFLFLANMQNRQNLRLLSTFFVVCIGILAFSIAVFPAKMIIETGDIMRFSASDMYDPNDLALMLVVGIPIALAHFFNSRGVARLALLGTIVVMGAAILRTASRGGFIGLCVIGVLFAFTKTRQVSRLKKFLILAAAVLAVFLASPKTLWERMNVVFSGSDYNFQVDPDVVDTPGRLQIWENALAMVDAKIVLFGMGVNQFPTAMGNRYGRYFYMTAHNTFLQMFGEMGIAGFIVFCILLATIWRNNQTAYRLFTMSGEEGFMADLPRYVNLSLVGFIVCSQFLSRGYSSLLPILLAYSISLRMQGEKSCDELEESGTADNPDGVPAEAV